MWGQRLSTALRALSSRNTAMGLRSPTDDFDPLLPQIGQGAGVQPPCTVLIRSHVRLLISRTLGSA